MLLIEKSKWSSDVWRLLFFNLPWRLTTFRMSEKQRTVIKVWNLEKIPDQSLFVFCPNVSTMYDKKVRKIDEQK